MTLKLPKLASPPPPPPPNLNNGRVEWKGEVYFTQYHRGVQSNTDIITLSRRGGGGGGGGGGGCPFKGRRGGYKLKLIT